jgi:hypothetical protein
MKSIVRQGSIACYTGKAYLYELCDGSQWCVERHTNGKEWALLKLVDTNYSWEAYFCTKKEALLYLTK